MEHTIEWYKRKIRVVTFIIGFCIAWFFNADTFVIVKNLSVDKDAREKMVNMATSYVQNNKITVDTLKIKNVIELKDYEEKLDSLLAIREQLVVDINNANSILGLGCWPPDSVTVTTSAKTKQKIYSPPIDTKSIPCKIFTSDSLRQKKIYTFKSKSIESMPVEVSTKNINNGTIAFNLGAKLCYFFRLFLFHFFGFFVTAIAISLGAPFWFDLLNKLMQLRTSTKEETETVKKTSTKQAVSPLDRVG